MNVIYRHKLTIGVTTYDVHPVYKDDMALDFQHETGQMFFRGSLSGKMNFVADDAALIIGAPFTTEFILTIDSSVDGGLTWAEFHVAKFYKTDCTIDSDDMKVTVKPNVKDRYQKVLDGYEKEFNLIELKPVIEHIRMERRAMIQIYLRGDSKVTNIVGGSSWETDFDADVNGDIDSHFHFKRVRNFAEMTLDTTNPFLIGTFSGEVNDDGTFILRNAYNFYYIQRQYIPISETITERFQTTINDGSSDRVIYGSQETGQEMNLTFFKLDNPEEKITATGIMSGIYCRILCDVPEYVEEGVTEETYPLASDDPNYGGNLHYGKPYMIYNITQTAAVSTTPTPWGRKNQTEYFNVPDNNYAYLPIGRNFWVNYSYWYYQPSSFDVDATRNMWKTITLKDAYPLHSVIQVLLDKLGTGVTFDDTAEYSQFLYGTTNPLDSNYHYRPYITQKSNLLKGEYSKAAAKAPVTLQTIMEMLKKVFGCYWYIDEQMKMHVEHISWFKNGGTYNGQHQVGIDLTAIENTRNNKLWSFDKNAWQYDKQDMPARYQYKWMDDGTLVFDGYALDVVSPFVQTDKVEEINIGSFTSDVDYMMVAPENCSKDGFALMMADREIETGINYLPIVVSTIPSASNVNMVVYVQNYFASLMSLMPAFLVSDLPSWTYQVNGINYSSKGIQRSKKQTLPVLVGNTLPDLMKLVRTGIGDGQIEKMSINLASRMANTTLKYETYAAE
jgi:hypothetical protein